MFDYMPYLSSINISYNKLISLPLIAFPNCLLIEHLDIKRNYISKISNTMFSNLKNLNKIYTYLGSQNILE